MSRAAEGLGLHPLELENRHVRGRHWVRKGQSGEDLLVIEELETGCLCRAAGLQKAWPAIWLSFLPAFCSAQALGRPSNVHKLLEKYKL